MSRATWTPEPDWIVQRSRCWAVTRAGCAPAAESLSKAAERAGRIIGESVAVQGVIYAMMKRDVDEPGDD